MYHPWRCLKLPYGKLEYNIW